MVPQNKIQQKLLLCLEVFAAAHPLNVSLFQKNQSATATNNISLNKTEVIGIPQHLFEIGQLRYKLLSACTRCCSCDMEGDNMRAYVNLILDMTNVFR